MLAGDGCHRPEPALRWTDGDAALDLPPAAADAAFVEVVVVATLPYPGAPPRRHGEAVRQAA